MKKIYYLLFISVFLGSQILEAQSIKRSTLGSAASRTTVVGNIKVASTFGQNCISCNSHTNATNSLRQGFQQPPRSNDLPCGFDSGIAVEEIQTPCGTYYNFEYTGLANPSNATFTWEFGQDASPATSSQMNVMNVGYSSVGDKMVRVLVASTSDCVEIVNVVIPVTETAFLADAIITDELCFGDANGSIELSISGGVSPYSIIWAGGQITPQITGLKAGLFPFTITDSDGCVWENVAEVGGPTEPVTIATIAKESESCAPASDGRIVIEPTGGTTPYFYEWSNGATTPIADSLAAGDYTLTVTDGNGCTQTGAFKLSELCKNPNDIVYDILTPNEDGQNDVWVIEGIENYPNNEVAIYNRWGNMVWNKNSYTNDWRGVNNDGKKLPAGGYYYIVLLNDDDNTRIGGGITILR